MLLRARGISAVGFGHSRRAGLAVRTGFGNVLGKGFVFLIDRRNDIAARGFTVRAGNLSAAGITVIGFLRHGFARITLAVNRGTRHVARMRFSGRIIRHTHIARCGLARWIRARAIARETVAGNRLVGVTRICALRCGTRSIDAETVALHRALSVCGARYQSECNCDRNQ